VQPSYRRPAQFNHTPCHKSTELKAHEKFAEYFAIDAAPTSRGPTNADVPAFAPRAMIPEIVGAAGIAPILGFAFLA
jgi:hypothetical protein